MGKKKSDLVFGESMSVAKMKNDEMSSLKLCKSKESGKLYFRCGSIHGAVATALEPEDFKESLDDLQVVKCKGEDAEGTPISFWMICMNSDAEVIDEF